MLEGLIRATHAIIAEVLSWLDCTNLPAEPIDRCECMDGACPMGHGDSTCRRPAAMLLHRRLHFGDDSLMCDVCAFDALQTGAFVGCVL